MADSKLSREHSLALLHKLANDDGYRSRYEHSPAAALAELGVPQALIDGLSAGSKAPTRLAPKTSFATALEHYHQGVAEVCLCQAVPQISLSVVAQAAATSSTIPFAAS